MEPLIDLKFLQELSGGDAKYIYELLDIFLGTTPEGLETLEQLIRDTNDWEATYKQAHFLKSSVGIVKIRDMHQQLARIEELGRKQEGREEILQLLDKILATFREAHPILIAERDKHKQLAGVA
jgi:HPt (histidine-containing phosphotransfer) domain-containing protein